MKDFERIDYLEKEVKYIHQKFAKIFVRMQNQAIIIDGVLQNSSAVLQQNIRLVKEMEKMIKEKNVSNY